MSKRLLSSILILSMFFVTMSWVPTVPFANLEPLVSDSKSDSSPEIQGPSELTPIDEQIPEGFNAYNVADDAPVDGVLNPVLVEQSGYAASENLSARTDSFENLEYNLPLDITHNWSADVAEVSVWNLEKLYAVNGTFNEGIPGYTVNPNGTLAYYPLGWSAISHNGDPGQSQQVSYEHGGDQYVTVQNTAKLTNLGQHQYTHYQGTNVSWVQTFENAPYTDQFLLQFDYLLLQGPLSVLFTGRYSLKVFIDDDVVSDIDLPTLSTRGTWFDSGSIPVSIASPSASMTLKIGIEINSDFMADADEDYDGDGSPDGAINTQFITVYLDDVSLIKATPPTPAQVQLEFTTGGSISSLSGFGTYTASITNSSYWTSSPVSVALTSNTSVSFDYKTRLFSHRFTDSNWRTKISSTGVAYTIDHGFSSALTFYTYVGYLGNYEDPKMVVIYPEDWENLTISDPFLSDITSSCTIGTGNLTVPTSIIDRPGWWEVKLASPNYAQSIKSQLLDSGWSDADVFRIGNTTRADITIGTDAQTLGSLTDVNFTWFKPSDEIWVTELRTGGALGQIYSSSQIFNPGTSPAGVWWVEVYWTNGTEVAYDRASFQVHHTANLVADPTEITTDTGLTIKGLVRFTDGDTGTNILDTSATLAANWSGSSVPFVANPVQNWWEADFDTAIIGAGDFIVVVNASHPYYDDISCQIMIHSINVTRLTSPNAPWTAAEWGSLVSLTFNFESYHHATDMWGPVINNTDISASINWTDGYWSVSEDVVPGIYNIDLDTNGVSAGTLLLNITFSKPNHYSKTIFLTLILSPMTSSLTVIGSLSDRVDIEESTSVKLLYALSNGTPISGANFDVTVSPSSGLDKTAVTEVGGEPGNYTVTLTPYSATVYTVRFVAIGPISEPASTVFVLVVNDVETGLMIYGDASLEIGLTETYNATFRYEMLNGTGIETAEIDVVYSGPIGMLSWNISEYGVGNYSIAFAASLPGAYIITLIGFKQYHQRASDSFSLIIKDIPTNLVLSVGTSDEMGLTDKYEMSFIYEMDNGTGIEDATIEVIHSGAPSAITSLVTPLGLGNYSIQFNATMSGGFLVTIVASKQYHQGSSNSFLLVVREITTSMVSLNGSGDFVGFGKSYQLFMSYTNGSGHGLPGANVSVVNADAGIAWSPTQNETPGVYSILLTPLTSGSLSVIVQATLLNHQTKVVFFTLTVTAIPTTLTTLNLSTSISADQNFTVYLQYQDEDTSPLENAILSILNPPMQLNYSSFEELGNGLYRVTLTPLSIGTFDIVFSGSKAGYGTDYTGFTLSATIIKTDLNVADDLSSDTVTYSEQYNLFVLYTRTDSGYNVTGATIRIETPSSGLSSTVVEEVDGGYTIILDPQKSGNWTISIYASRDNHEESLTHFRLEVEPISITVEFVSDLTAMENQEFPVTVRLLEFGTNNTIDDALVWYRFSVSKVGLFREMNSTGAPGEYAVRHQVPLYANTIYRLEINVEKENYILTDIPDVPFVITPNVIERNSLLIVSSSGIGTFLVIFFVALRISTRRKKAQIETDLINKRRFDDADNIIGVIVMHKNSGIPVYSRIVKGGFEEGIVAAFISAVTHFREEFEMFDEEAMKVIPISDIIRAVQTKNLICAFVTIRSASIEHNRKMESYGEQVATYLDDFYTESRPSGALDSRIAEILDYVFDETMDGNLVKFYKVAEDQQFPRRYRLLEQLLEDIETRHCARPVHLAQGVSTFGVSEAHGCTLVTEAIEKRLIMPCDEHEPTVEDMEFAEFFAKRNNDDGT